MQAIKTKYFGPTNNKGSRIQASCEVRKIYVPYNYALDIEANHRAACEELLRVLGWTADNSVNFSDMIGGWHTDCMFWVFANTQYNRTTINSANKHTIVDGKMISEVAA